MAPVKKRAAADDFIYTLSDDEGPVEEEVILSEPPRKKSKTTKKQKKGAAVAESEEEEEAPEGVWGRNDENDGAMDSDFDFEDDFAGGFDEEQFEGWGFDGARDTTGAKKGTDLDEIIRRRREKNAAPSEPVGVTADEQVENDMDVDMDDDDDEVLADDAFGMNAGSDDEEAENEEPVLEDGDEPASDDDSVATPAPHPDDDASDMSDEEDAEEEAKREAFFAAGEKLKPTKKTDASSFLAMSLSRPIIRGISEAGFTKPTPIQSKAIPIALLAKDLVVSAPTGSGKTAAFLVPILERWLYRPSRSPTTRVVILLPTRELAMQCHAVALKLAKHLEIKFALAVGGLSLKRQELELRARPDIVIGTPGRFIDHMRNSAGFNIDSVEVLVLDEADRMLEDGFADELNEILTTMPKSRQTMLFSATMNSTVDHLVRAGLNKPVRLMVDAQKKTVGTLVQEFVRLRPARVEKRVGYLVHLCKTLYTERVIVFLRQKKDAHRIRIIFGLMGISCAELHGSMNQTQRIESVEAFRDGKVTHLLATDLASRGLDIKGVDTVINYEGPKSLDTYVHRVGRTARAGRKGTALTLASEDDRKVVKAAIKAGKSQGAKIISRNIDPADVDKIQDQIDGMDDEIEEILQEEKEEKVIAQAEMEVRKGENLITHEKEIKSRPKRTWFESEHDKQKAKDAEKDKVMQLRESLKNKGAGKLSNKAKKQLDAKALRSESNNKLWKPGKKFQEEAKAKFGKKAAEKRKTAAKGKPKAQVKGKGRK